MEAVKEISPEEISKKLSEAKPEERAAILAQIAEEAGVARHSHDPVITLSPEEQARLVDGIVGEAKKVVEERAKEVERKYDIPHGEAVAMVEDEASRLSKERILKRQKYDIIGKRLATALQRQSGALKPGEYERAVDMEVNFLKKHYGTERAERAMSLADDTKGGALAPEVFEAEVYHNIQQTALARRYCEVKEIPRGQEIKDWPKITSDLDAEVKAEAAGAGTSDIATTTFNLQPKAIVSLSGPISIDLLEASAINIIDHLIGRASAVFAKKEDTYLFTGDGGTNWNGLLTDAPNANVVDMATGEDSIEDINFDHMINMEYALDDHYIPDPEDVVGSRVTAGEALYWFHRTAYKHLKKAKDGQARYHFSIEEMMREKRVNGNRFRRVPYLPSAPSASTKFGLFGNLKYTWVGIRPGIQVEIANQGIVGNTNLWQTGQKAIRFIEFWDYALVDDGSLSVLKTGASS